MIESLMVVIYLLVFALMGMAVVAINLIITLVIILKHKKTHL